VDLWIEAGEQCDFGQFEPRLFRCRRWMLERFLPQSAKGFVIVGGISGNGKPLILFSRHNLFMVNFPLRNFKSRDAERAQARPHVLWNGAKVLANDARCASRFHSNAQIFLALTLIRIAVFRCFVVPWCEMRRATARSLEHLL